MHHPFLDPFWHPPHVTSPSLTLPTPLPPACLFRFNVLSLVYLLFLLLLPWFPGPTRGSAGGHTGRLLKALLGTSILFLLAHFVFQICLYTLPILDQLLGPSCSTWEVLARHIGVTRGKRRTWSGAVARPMGTSTRVLPQGEEEDVERRGGTADGDTPLSARLRVTAHWLLWLTGKGLAMLLLALAGGYGTGGDMRTGKPGSGAENCTVHVMGNSPQPGRRRPAERLALHALGHVVMNQSYVCALIAMMVWSITYQSWLTFVLLLWACLIWTVRSRHHFAMLCSPFLLLYGIALCSLQYVWGMDLAPELPTRVGFMSLKQLGLEHPKYPCLDLGAKLLLTLTFWLLLRQFVKEKLLTRRCPATPLLEVTISDTEPSRQRDVLKALGDLVRDFYAKYWICVCAGMFIVVSFAGRLVVYKIVYMFLFLLCLTLFQVYYSLWRKVLKGFWWLVVAYTMLVLIAVYTFQFEDFPMYWRNLTGLTDEQLGDLGLEQFSVSELFSSTLIPGFFLLACILQLHYFHRPFMHITDLEHIPAATPSPCHIPMEDPVLGCTGAGCCAAAADSAETGDADTMSQVPTKWGLVLERLIVLGWTFSDMLTRGQVFVGRLLELHILKLVALYTVWVALQEVSLMNFLLVLLWTFAMPYCRFRHMASCLSTVWTCIIIVCKMLYQLKIVNPSEYSSNCTQPQLNSTNLSPEELGNSTLYRGPVDPANWFGIRKGYPNLGYIQNHLLVLLLLVFEAVVYRRQEYYRKQHQLVAPVTETIFEDISREHLGHGLGSCAKYFLNYFYYKFGLERTWEWLRAAGDNADRLNLARDPCNPTPNFIHCRSYLDMVKVVVFRYLFWFVLVVVFITGATRISLFGLGYLLACFYLLLFGTAMLRKPARARLVLWDCLILYNITVIISKNMLSLLSCVFVQQMQSNFCWVIQLFSLVCTVKGYYDPKEMGKDQDCSLPVEEAGIIWDSICFFFLLLQRRIFLSYYFLHVMLDLQASALQASRGVALFKASILKSMRSRQAAEKKSLAQLKRQWLDHAAVLHSGEYFLFESDSEEEEEAAMLEEPRPGRQSAFQLAYQAWVTNTRTALQQQEQEQLERPGAEVTAGDSRGREEELEAPEEAEGQEEEEEEGSERSNVVQRALNTLRFLWVLCRAMVDGLTQWLDACTQEHTDMSTVLRLERYVLTRRLAMGEDVHRGVLDELSLPPPEEPPEEPSPRGSRGSDPQNGVASSCHRGATPAPAGHLLPRGSQEQVTTWGSREDVAGSQELLALPQNRSRTASELLMSRRLYFPELEESELFYRSHNRFLKLLLAGYRCVAAHSELLCYFVIILNNMVTASVISLFLPILVFLWAMLSIPRPTKRFWMTAIIFTEVMVVVKYLFQFGFFPWNGYAMLVRNEGKPFFPPRILGLEKTDRYIKYDLIQLLALFFHRSLLLSYGLWDHEEDPFPKKKAEVERAEDEEEEERREEAASPPLPVGEEGTEALAEPEAPGAAAGPEPEGDAVGQEEGSRATQLRFRRKKWLRKLKAFGLRVKLFFLTMAQNMYQPVRGFFWDILHTQHRAATDVYAFMFLADVVDFIIIIFGFWAFGKHSAAADITSSLSDDQVPEAFLVMLLIQFTTMVIDRALYLRKTVLGKLIFQVILVFSIHLWMFFILPAVTERLFSLNTVAQLWYFVKCIYFSLSAYQIRCGYPTRILGNFLTKKYNHLNLFLFQGFRLVPFLVELRAVMDWVWTDTTLSLSNWMCVEDIYANIFIIKCSRETEKKYPQPKGQKKKKIVKYGMGGLIILFLVAIIWFPLLFMSLVRSVVGVVNHPIDVTVTLKLGGYEPLFTMSAQQQSIQPFTPQDYEALTNEFERHPVAMQFITLYGYEDIVTARIEGSSGSLWSISPPSREQMRRELQNGSSDITLPLPWTFRRDLGKGGTVEHTFDKHTTDLQPGAPQRMELAQLRRGTRDTPVQVPKLFPKYIRAPNGPEANPVKQLLPDGEDSYLDVEVQLKRERAGVGRGADSFLEWWVVRLKEAPPRDGNILPMVIFNDKVSPPSLGFLAGYGIMGLYVSIVLVIGKFVRGFFSEISHSIMFEELPCVDRILKLCQDIFLVRETGELELEEELYAKLIFLYRSPETMIKWTREKE
ncbi:PREDICTED: piezo-type mechanosensitive ion channel component 1 [Charadrius vociferus]|uniref:piezo-type mechanosensitive ion channel component 1 n=1 Tax=Charadrius vociferus TaxID=50402 RepID=UPI000521B9D5|nr:PREDICTED: piezo-type mechanosensitive ion channel component 1 [Charadrius vociferus]